MATRGGVFRFLVLLFVIGAIVGCGKKNAVPVRGRIQWKGQPLSLAPRQSLRVVFCPVVDDGQFPGDGYAASVRREDGVFYLPGKDGLGIPPGTYRISVELWDREVKKDRLKGRFKQPTSPLIREVNDRTGDIALELTEQAV